MASLEKDIFGDSAGKDEADGLPEEFKTMEEEIFDHASPELVARDEGRSSSESRRTQRSDDARGPGADHDQIEVVSGQARSVASPGPPGGSGPLGGTG